MNALSDYLTKSGREESGGLLGAYIGFFAGYEGIQVTFAKHHGPIPGVDMPYNPSAYYSPTVLDYADSPSEFALKDLASSGDVYDYARHLKSILSANNLFGWLQAALQKTGIDILNTTPLPWDERGRNQADILVMHNVAQDNNQGDMISNLVHGTLFRSPTRYDEYSNSYDSQQQMQALENAYTDIARSAQAVVDSSDAQDELYQRIMQDAVNASGDMQIRQAQVEADAFQQAQTAQRNMLLSNLSALKVLKAREEQDDMLQYMRTVQDAQIHIQDPYHRSEYEQKLYEATKPTDPKGFTEFK